MSLAELQQRVRDAIVLGRDALENVSLVAGQGDGWRRLAIHHRHYETSLVKGLLRRFPATAWLLGSPLLIEAARIFIKACPPTAPCLAEYGETFPPWLSGWSELAHVPYAGDFAALDWQLGKVSIEVETPAVTFDVFAALEADAMTAVRLRLQPGLDYLKAAWPIDNLMRLYLTDTAPEHLVLEPEHIWLQVRGARGQFDFARLSESEFLFRQGVHAAIPLGEAADCALDRDDSFDPGRALTALFTDDLVTSILTAASEDTCEIHR
ncbi:MAG: putative DNA-binding domain-containing protein [Acidobacteria bacterium]|nr:putative DNA-binding domain-containing protein [Acidobacteriota bacterium]